MAGEKTVNYTAEQVSALVAGYQAGQTVESLASTVGKSVRSVVAKLSREGVYKAKSATKAAHRVTKAEMIDAIASAIGVSADSLESLEKATGPALELVRAALVGGE